jgi:hypothetical protein
MEAKAQQSTLSILQFSFSPEQKSDQLKRLRMSKAFKKVHLHQSGPIRLSADKTD